MHTFVNTKNSKLSSSVFKRYLLSYSIVFLVPIISIILFTYSYFIGILKNEILTNNINMLEYVKEAVDTQIYQIRVTCNEIQRNNKLTPYSINQTMIAKMDVINELKEYQLRNDITERLILYIDGEDHLYTSTGTYTINNFVDIYHYNGWDSNEFDAILNLNINTQLITESYAKKMNININNNGDPRYIIYKQSLPLNSINPHTTLLFVINENKINGFISSIINAHNANTIILDNKCNIVTSTEDTEEILSIDFKNIIENKGKSNGMLTIDCEDYYYVYSKSKMIGWTYLTLIPEKVAMADMFAIRKRSFYVIISVILLGTIIIYYVTDYNYSPIKQLNEFVGKVTLGSSDIVVTVPDRIDARDEFETIKMVINHMYRNDEYLRGELEKSKPAVKEFLLKMLLQGEFNNVSEFNKTSAGTGIYFSKEYYNVFIISIGASDSYDDKTPKSDVIQYVEESFITYGEVYGFDNVEGNNLIFILGSEILAPYGLKNELLSLLKNINNIWGMFAIVGIGTQYGSVSDIPQSYAEATVALDYTFRLEKDKVILFSDINSSYEEGINSYPKGELEQIQFSIKQGNIEEVEYALASIVDVISKNNLPLFFVRCICYDIINTIMKTMNQLNIGFTSMKNDYMTIMSRCDTVDKLVLSIKELSVDICDIISMSKESQNRTLRDRALQYIEANYRNPCFSVKVMAEQLNVTQSYLSRFFKDQTDTTITNYVMYKRIEEAKKLLESTNEPLKDIIERVGYYNEASFIRMFKKMEGITPGEYRELLSRF